MSRPPRFALIGLGAVLVLVLAIAAGLALLPGTDAFKSRLERHASQALGLELSFAGRPVIGLVPRLRVTLGDVQLKHRGKPVASARQATVDVAPMSLLGEALRIERIGLAQPTLTLTRGRDGRFDVEPEPAAAAAADLPAQAGPDVSLVGGSLVFVDQRDGKGFEARDCQGGVRHLQRAQGRRADLLRELAFTAELRCAEVRQDEHVLADVAFTADAKHGIVEVKPLSARLFGAAGQGSLRADFTGAVASYQMAWQLAQFPVEAIFGAKSSKPLVSGRLDFNATLTTRGTTLEELKQATAGRVSLRGTSLTVHGTDLDRAFARFESSQNLDLVDVGAVFFAGPAGLLVTKGYDFAQLAQGNGGNSEIRTLVSDWTIDRGVARAQDVAMATKANRVALQGRLDFVNERFDDVAVALVDAKGCVIVRQTIRGSFRRPVIDKPNAVEALAGPALRLLKKGGEAVFGRSCDAFYSGAVAPPG